jgi:hypothetical protein
VEEGSDPTLDFTVSSNPPLRPQDTTHAITRDGHPATRRFQAHHNHIVLTKLELEDTGMYHICCENEDHLSGKGTFEIRVVKSMSSEMKLAHSSCCLISPGNKPSADTGSYCNSLSQPQGKVEEGGERGNEMFYDELFFQ